MTGFLRDLRLLPIAVVASGCLLALIAADLLLDHEFATSDPLASEFDAAVVHTVPGVARLDDSQGSWAQQMFNFPSARNAPAERTDLARLPAIPPLAADKNGGDIITGTVPESAAKSEKPKGEGSAAPSKEIKEPAPTPNGVVIPINATPGPSAAERALLERLQERRQELDRRARELDIREGLIGEAEKRVDAKLTEIKQNEAQLAVAVQKKDEAEAGRFKGIVTMYENMKPRDAAKIFDRLDVDVLLQVASQINPRNMSEILAQMSPDAAQRLTVELANRAQAVSKGPNGELPKIEGHPTGQ
jgi:flagellar motility protein MotE (MotC chaperone)